MTYCLANEAPVSTKEAIKSTLRRKWFTREQCQSDSGVLTKWPFSLIIIGLYVSHSELSYTLSLLCILVIFCWVSESCFPAMVSSRSMEISTWVLTDLPALHPGSAIAMETLESGLTTWRDLSETHNASSWSHMDKYTDSSSTKEIKETDSSFSLTV